MGVVCDPCFLKPLTVLMAGMDWAVVVAVAGGCAGAVLVA